MVEPMPGVGVKVGGSGVVAGIDGIEVIVAVGGFGVKVSTFVGGREVEVGEIATGQLLMA